jgi:hypothetical protein
MKISRQQRQKEDRAFLIRNLGWAVGLALAFVVGMIVGRQEWQRAIRDLWSVPVRIVQSVIQTETGDLSTLVFDMNFSSYQDILSQREQALQDGVYIPSSRDFVTATIQAAGSTIPVRMRLLPGPADHLNEGGKWGFEVQTRQNYRLFDMQQFHLLDPAANNWLNQWAFSRALQREDILAARYRFVRLVLNGKDWGLYGLQEEITGELPAAQGRSPGITLGYDATLLWKSIVHFQGDVQAAYTDPVANLSVEGLEYLEIDAPRDIDIATDPELSAQRDRAVALLRGLQAGTLRPSDVFDAQQYGRFLALVDLWGALQSTSLINLHYYYNPASDRLEPIGFSANPLGSAARLSLATTYGDPALQIAYTQEALRVSQPEYLDGLQDELESEFSRLQPVVSAEYPNLRPPWDEIRHRQEQIRLSLDPAQPVFAYLGSPELNRSGVLRVYVANVLNLPVEIIGFDIHGATFLPANPEWLGGEPDELLIDRSDQVVLYALDTERAPVVRYVHFDVPLIEIHRQDKELDFMQELDILVETRVLGLPTSHWTLAQPGYPDMLPVGGNE